MLDIPIAAQPRQESYDFVERAFAADPIGPWQAAFVFVFVSPQPPSYRVPTPATDSLGHSLFGIKPLQARKITSLMSKLAPAIIDDEPTPCCIDSTCWVRCFSSLFETSRLRRVRWSGVPMFAPRPATMSQDRQRAIAADNRSWRSVTARMSDFGSGCGKAGF